MPLIAAGCGGITRKTDDSLMLPLTTLQIACEIGIQCTHGRFIESEQMGPKRRLSAAAEERTSKLVRKRYMGERGNADETKRDAIALKLN